MKVLILERHSDWGLVAIYSMILEKRGHQIVTAQLLNTMPGYVESPDTYLSQFNRVVCHPHWMDVPALKKELERRKDFGVLIYKLDGPSEFEGRLRYENWFDKNTLEKFVEEPL